VSHSYFLNYSDRVDNNFKNAREGSKNKYNRKRGI